MVALIALGVSILTFYLNGINRRRNEMKTRIDMFNFVSEYESKLLEANIDKCTLRYDFYEEKLANVYEVLCKEYLDKKIDKKYFEDMYKHTLIQFVEKEDNQKYYCMIKGEFNFVSTLSVYKKLTKR